MSLVLMGASSGADPHRVNTCTMPCIARTMLALLGDYGTVSTHLHHFISLLLGECATGGQQIQEQCSDAAINVHDLSARATQIRISNSSSGPSWNHCMCQSLKARSTSYKAKA